MEHFHPELPGFVACLCLMHVGNHRLKFGIGKFGNLIECRLQAIEFDLGSGRTRCIVSGKSFFHSEELGFFRLNLPLEIGDSRSRLVARRGTGKSRVLDNIWIRPSS
jgi:hypothetical protein